MSSGGLVAPLTSSPLPSPSRMQEIQTLAQRFTPSQGWAMFVFLAMALLIVGNSVTTADWVETPSLGAVLLWAALAGLLLSKVKAHAIWLHIAGLAIGLVVVVWQTASLIEDQSLLGQVLELWHRLQDWYAAAESGGISTDLLPFTLILVSASWLLGESDEALDDLSDRIKLAARQLSSLKDEDLDKLMRLFQSMRGAK